MKGNGIKGILAREVTPIDLKDYNFNNDHINIKRNHGVTKEDAQYFVSTAKVEITRWNGTVKFYISKTGSTVIDIAKREIKTAYKAEEYDERNQKMIEVFEDD